MIEDTRLGLSSLRLRSRTERYVIFVFRIHALEPFKILWKPFLYFTRLLRRVSRALAHDGRSWHGRFANPPTGGTSDPMSELVDVQHA